MYLPNPSAIDRKWLKVKVSNSLFFFFNTYSLTKVKESNLLHQQRERTNGFIPFPKALEESEMQTFLWRHWSKIDDSISNDDNRYTKSAPQDDVVEVDVVEVEVLVLVVVVVVK